MTGFGKLCCISARLHTDFLLHDFLTSDVTDESSYSAFVSQVKELVGPQGLNLLINNAGVAPKSTRINMVKWQQMTDTLIVNTVAPLMLTKVSFCQFC